jgi:hypothetical protein
MSALPEQIKEFTKIYPHINRCRADPRSDLLTHARAI